ncbi:MAG: hypothetical protein ABFR62_02285 [Bacteroidota bacterium]
MKKYLTILVIAIGLLISCGTSEMVIPEGTPPEVAQVMKTYHIKQDSAVKLLDALESQSGLSDVKMSDISSVQERIIQGRRVLAVKAGFKDFYVNLD